MNCCCSRRAHETAIFQQLTSFAEAGGPLFILHLVMEISWEQYIAHPGSFQTHRFPQAVEALLRAGAEVLQVTSKPPNTPHPRAHYTAFACCFTFVMAENA